MQQLPFLSVNLTNLIQSFSWWLFHSLWMAAVIGVFLYILISVVKLSATQRLRVCLAAYLGFMLIVLFKLTEEVRKTFFVSQVMEGSSQDFELTKEEFLQQIDYIFNGFIYHYNQIAIGIVLCWSLVFLFRAGRLLIASRQLAVLRKSATPIDDPALKRFLKKQQQQHHIQRPIQLLHHSLCTSPMQAGFRRPAIILPTTLCQQLPEEEVQLILIHEVVHIQNRDYLINYIQEWLRAVFFFNPGVIFISRSIKLEREFACDERVVSQIQNKLLYAKTLLSSYSLAIGTHAAGVNFLGSDATSVTTRIQRLIGDQKLRSVCFSAAGLLGGLWFLLYSLNPDFRSFPSVAAHHKVVSYPQKAEQPAIYIPAFFRK